MRAYDRRPASGASRFLRIFGWGLAVILSAVTLFDVVVDPYRLWDLFPIQGLNRNKPVAYKIEDVSKPYVELRIHPTTVLIGSSRTNGALNPDALERLPGPKNIYNFADSGFGLRDQRRFLEHALAAGGVETVVITVELTDFIKPDHPWPETPDPSVDRLLIGPDGKPNHLRWIAAAQDSVTAFVRLGAFIDALDTVLSQDPANGTESGRGWLIKDFVREIRREGHFALFSQKDRENVQKLSGLPPRLYGPDDAQGGLTEFERIVTDCQTKGVRLYVVLPPFHAQMLEIYRRLGLWPALEDWKRLLARVVEAENRRRPGAPPVELWDFADYDAWTLEPVPPPADHRLMRWYWESAHYQPSLGELIWRRLFDPSAAEELADFGVQLTAQTVEARIAEVRRHQSASAEAVDRELDRILGTGWGR